MGRLYTERFTVLPGKGRDPEPMRHFVRVPWTPTFTGESGKRESKQFSD